MKPILVAYDLSDPSRRAVTFAHALATRLGTHVEVLYVLDDPFSDLEGVPGESVWATEEEMKWHVARVHETIQAEVRGLVGGAEVATRVVRGGPLKVLLDQAESGAYDMIVSGTTGKGGVARALMGSVSSRLVQRSPIPVLTVP